uniref:SCAN box domain-containing protein n=1 Tax=Gouania willdenowi TaxID=441366 RepID=A0A8C5D4E5_GOUWI
APFSPTAPFQDGGAADAAMCPGCQISPGSGAKQNEHDARWEQDKLQQENRWQSMERRVDQLQQEVKAEHPVQQPVVEGAAAQAGPPVLPALVRIPSGKGPKMQPYQNDEDIDHYLTTFERIATACQWPKGEWALYLAPLLNGKARAAYVAMDVTETMDYVKVKKAVLEKFEISAETYRMQFRSTEVNEDETPRELQSRLKDLYDKWMTPRERTREQIGDAIVQNQNQNQNLY